jgi:hypothetical protein
MSHDSYQYFLCRRLYNFTLIIPGKLLGAYYVFISTNRVSTLLKDHVQKMPNLLIVSSEIFETCMVGKSSEQRATM